MTCLWARPRPRCRQARCPGPHLAGRPQGGGPVWGQQQQEQRRRHAAQFGGATQVPVRCLVAQLRCACAASLHDQLKGAGSGIQPFSTLAANCNVVPALGAEVVTGRGWGTLLPGAATACFCGDIGWGVRRLSCLCTSTFQARQLVISLQQAAGITTISSCSSLVSIPAQSAYLWCWCLEEIVWQVAGCFAA